MNKKTFLIITIFAILFLVILSTYTEQSYSGKIKKVESTETKTTIFLENINETFISFDNIKLDPECEQIEIAGKEDNYKNQKQIIIDKISCLK